MTIEMRCKIYAVVMAQAQGTTDIMCGVIEWLPTNDSVDISFEQAFLLDVWLAVMLSIMSVNCGYVYLMLIVALEFSFQYTNTSWTFSFKFIRSLCRLAASTQPLGRKMLCTTQQRPLCSIKAPYNIAVLCWVKKIRESGKRVHHHWKNSNMKSILKNDIYLFNCMRIKEGITLYRYHRDSSLLN